MLYYQHQWITHLMTGGSLYVWVMIVVRMGMMNICPRPNGCFIQMRARQLDHVHGHLAPSPPPGKYNSLNPFDPHTPLHSPNPASTHTTYLLNLTGWRDDPENHIMYISLAVAANLHVEDS